MVSQKVQPSMCSDLKQKIKHLGVNLQSQNIGGVCFSVQTSKTRCLGLLQHLHLLLALLEILTVGKVAIFFFTLITLFNIKSSFSGHIPYQYVQSYDFIDVNTCINPFHLFYVKQIILLHNQFSLQKRIPLLKKNFSYHGSVCISVKTNIGTYLEHEGRLADLSTEASLDRLNSRICHQSSDNSCLRDPVTVNFWKVQNQTLSPSVLGK